RSVPLGACTTCKRAGDKDRVNRKAARLVFLDTTLDGKMAFETNRATLLSGSHKIKILLAACELRGLGDSSTTVRYKLDVTSWRQVGGSAAVRRGTIGEFALFRLLTCCHLGIRVQSSPSSEELETVPHLFTLSPDTKVDEAISQLVSYSISSAPVVERLKDAETNQVFARLVGFVSSFDFLPREETGSLVTLGETKDDVARRILGRTVEDVMTRDPISVTTNQNMKEAAEVMAGHRLHALPVVDAKHGHCVGIITAEDVMRDVMKTARSALPADLAA
ncbi:hypothetical protein THAOC_14262, partial [Thalassiosira oceanica]